ncbi:pentatricopeptide repeat-containing protein At5g39710-like [Lotus japonicus]|uniref:pentatricopeptide repeat-containing protein At5g39710-like n=1 Tax=Lotus japonicus TaxID=34305 RepID=UPI0025879E22|nr:pentatricopeptide repeat-containing protein At5g39710-like [Lotus japonicus]XP_057422126.1 pentatricopeptide repeat-containing protein At5g39710-like [Lotus japonicus]XP_057422127.1 pentatricopeptide repeat-containing protein At5g39710-like [Lotus japonicus]XP_057422128.1 pentatricopeptide repeat-containing protein At5g39710-like [Lotus japonicus]XP_057422129.1 pentatricopeptide repeat-containing protein At5g39710-like [Lotus japonicus]XP_057422130.1 pentatricopeptide repeat-containing prot
MKLLRHHHRVPFTAILKTTFHSPPPPKPFIHHRASFTANPITTFRAMPPNVNTQNVMIRRFASAAGNSESESPDVDTYNKMIAASCKENKVGEALGFLKAMIEKGMESNSIPFNEVIKGLCAEAWWMREAQKLVEEKNLNPERALGVWINISMLENLRHAVELYDQMRVRGLSPNESTYTTLIDAICKQVPVGNEAYTFLREMIDSGFSPSRLHADTYEKLIEGMCDPWNRSPSEAFDLFREMLRRGVSPNKHTYNSLMNVYCVVEGEFSKAFHIHDEIMKKGFLPDFVCKFSPSLVTYNALIYGCCSLGRVEEAVGIMRGMVEMGLSPDDVSYSLVISGFLRTGEMKRAFDMFHEKEMNENGKYWQHGLFDIYSSLMDGDLFDEVMYTSLINTYLDEAEWLKVVKLYDEMSSHSDLPYSLTYILLLNGLDKKAWTRETKKNVLNWIYGMFWHMESYIPTYLTYDILIENCSDNEFKNVVGLVKSLYMRDVENIEAEKAYDTMLQWNYKADGTVCNLLIFEHCRCDNDNVHKAYNMYKEMVHYGFASHMLSVLALIKALSQKGMDSELNWVIQNVLRSCDLNGSELHKALNEIDIKKDKIDALMNVLAEKAMDCLLLNGGKCSYASASA